MAQRSRERALKCAVPLVPRQEGGARPGLPAWPHIEAAIAEHDPHCNGVLLLGLDAPEAQLRASFERAAPHAICRGFAVGRSIFGQPARDWMHGTLDDAAVVVEIATRYERMIDAWRSLRP